MVSAIETNQLTRTLGGRRVLDQLSVRLMPGEVVALRGANGAGKSTLLQCMAGLLRPTSGSVYWLGKPARPNSLDYRPIGLVGHESYLYPELTVTENLLFAARLNRVVNAVAGVRSWIERVQLTPMASRPVAQLSRGMRQRLSIARALMHEPAVVLLDEPFSGLDEESRQWLTQLVDELRLAGRAVLFSSHGDLPSHEIANRTCYLSNGRLTDRDCAGQAQEASRSGSAVRPGSLSP